MPHSTTSTLTADDKRKIKSAVPPSTCHIFGMARGQIYHAPFTASSPSEWEPLDLRGVIVFGRDTKKYEIQDDASSGGSSRGSLASAGTSGSSGSSGSIRASDVANEEPGSVSGLGDGDGTLDLAAGLGVKDDDLWFRLVEIDPHQKKPSKVVWRQPVSSASSDYKVLVPFFHAFSGNVSAVSFWWSSGTDHPGGGLRFCRAACLGLNSMTTMRRTSFLRPLWSALKRDVSLLFYLISYRSSTPCLTSSVTFITFQLS